jgi:hypothetical protein
MAVRFCVALRAQTSHPKIHAERIKYLKRKGSYTHSNNKRYIEFPPSFKRFNYFDSSVGRLTGPLVWRQGNSGSIPGTSRDFLFTKNIQSGPGDSPAPFSIDTAGSFGVNQSMIKPIRLSPCALLSRWIASS